MKRINTHLTKQQIEALKKLADKTGLTVAEHIRRAIDEYLEKKK
jgi:predicted DNA-binding protein